MRGGWFAVLLVPLVFVGVPKDASPERDPAHALVRITARGCTAVDTVATGWRTDGGLVVTVAHAVRGSDAVRADGTPARVVAVDNRTDVAVLVPASGLAASTLDIASGPNAAPHVWLARFAGERAGDTRTVSSTAAGPLVTATIDEPIDGVDYSRHAFPVTVAVDHGDSGAPVVDGRGHVTGMLFATARDGSPVTYAVAADDIRDALHRVDVNSPAVDTGRCN